MLPVLDCLPCKYQTPSAGGIMEKLIFYRYFYEAAMLTFVIRIFDFDRELAAIFARTEYARASAGWSITIATNRLSHFLLKQLMICTFVRNAVSKDYTPGQMTWYCPIRSQFRPFKACICYPSRHAPNCGLATLVYATDTSAIQGLTFQPDTVALEAISGPGIQDGTLDPTYLLREEHLTHG